MDSGIPLFQRPKSFFHVGRRLSPPAEFLPLLFIKGIFTGLLQGLPDQVAILLIVQRRPALPQYGKAARKLIFLVEVKNSREKFPFA